MHHRLPTGCLLVVLSVVSLAGAGIVASSAAGQVPLPTQQTVQAEKTSSVTPISECQRITTPGHYRLASDITNASEKYCITIKASDVVLDGAGHTIDGVGWYWDTSEDDPTIAVRAIGYKGAGDQVTNVTIRNVVTTQYGYGFYLARGSNNSIVDNVARSNGKYGIYLGYTANDNVVAGNRITNTTNGDPDVAGEAIVLAHSANRNVVRNNSVRGTGGLGIAIHIGNHTRVVNNSIIDSARLGIWDGGKGTEIVDNVVNRSGNIGVFGTGSGTTVTDNVVHRSDAVGIKYNEANGARIEGNDVRHNDRGISIGRADDAELNRNYVAGNDRHGIVLRGDGGEMVLGGNTFGDNGEWDILSEERTGVVTVDEATLGDGTTVSFEGRKIAVAGSTTVPEFLPQGTRTVGGMVKVWSPAGDRPWLDLRLSHDPSAVDDARSIDLWVHREGWRQVPASDVKRDADALSTNVTDIGRTIYVAVGATADETTDEPPAETTDEPPGETTDEPPGETTDEPPGETTDEPPGETTGDSPGETTAETPTAGGGPGFGFAGGLLGLLLAALIARGFSGQRP